jgi:hypothetical protein
LNSPNLLEPKPAIHQSFTCSKSQQTDYEMPCPLRIVRLQLWTMMSRKKLSAMSTFRLIFDNMNYSVPRKSVFELLDSRRALLDATDYTVQSCVPLDVFGAFIDSLRNHTKLTVTKSNAAFLLVLANEFGLDDLRSECRLFSGDSVAAMADRLSQLERNLSSSLTPIGQLERQVENVVERLCLLESQFAFMRTKWPGFESKLQEMNPDVFISELCAALKEKSSLWNSSNRPADETAAPCQAKFSTAANRAVMPFAQAGLDPEWQKKAAKWSTSYAGGQGNHENPGSVFSARWAWARARYEATKAGASAPAPAGTSGNGNPKSAVATAPAAETSRNEKANSVQMSDPFANQAPKSAVVTDSAPSAETSGEQKPDSAAAAPPIAPAKASETATPQAQKSAQESAPIGPSKQPAVPQKSQDPAPEQNPSSTNHVDQTPKPLQMAAPAQTVQKASAASGDQIPKPVLAPNPVNSDQKSSSTDSVDQTPKQIQSTALEPSSQKSSSAASESQMPRQAPPTSGQKTSPAPSGNQTQPPKPVSAAPPAPSAQKPGPAAYGKSVPATPSVVFAQERVSAASGNQAPKPVPPALGQKPVSATSGNQTPKPVPSTAPATLPQKPASATSATKSDSRNPNDSSEKVLPS